MLGVIRRPARKCPHFEMMQTNSLSFTSPDVCIWTLYVCTAVILKAMSARIEGHRICSFRIHNATQPLRVIDKSFGLSPST
jgi:hypothetical protein